MENTSNLAIVHFYRTKSLKGAMIKAKLRMNNEPVSTIKRNWKTTIAIPPGAYVFSAKTEATTKIELQAEQGKEYYIKCGMGFGLLVGRIKFTLVDAQKAQQEMIGLNKVKPLLKKCQKPDNRELFKMEEQNDAFESAKNNNKNSVMTRCKNCGWENPANNAKCEKCNVPMSSPANEPTPSDSASHESLHQRDTALGCPKCGYPMRPGEKSCPECGNVFDIEKQDIPVIQEPKSGEAPPVFAPAPKPAPVVPTSDVSSPAEKTCIACNASIPETARFCPECGKVLVKGDVSFDGTINPWIVAEQIQIPECSLSFIAGDGVPTNDAQLRFSGSEIQLNRANTEPGNQTITSKLQAELTFENDKWYLQDKSALRTTYIYAGEKIELKSGDIIVLGNRSFKFTDVKKNIPE